METLTPSVELEFIPTERDLTRAGFSQESIQQMNTRLSAIKSNPEAMMLARRAFSAPIGKGASDAHSAFLTYLGVKPASEVGGMVGTVPLVDRQGVLFEYQGPSNPATAPIEELITANRRSYTRLWASEGNIYDPVANPDVDAFARKLAELNPDVRYNKEGGYIVNEKPLAEFDPRTIKTGLADAIPKTIEEGFLRSWFSPSQAVTEYRRGLYLGYGTESAKDFTRRSLTRFKYEPRIDHVFGRGTSEKLGGYQRSVIVRAYKANPTNPSYMLYQPHMIAPGNVYEPNYKALCTASEYGLKSLDPEIARSVENQRRVSFNFGTDLEAALWEVNPHRADRFVEGSPELRVRMMRQMVRDFRLDGVRADVIDKPMPNAEELLRLDESIRRSIRERYPGFTIVEDAGTAERPITEKTKARPREVQLEFDFMKDPEAKKTVWTKEMKLPEPAKKVMSKRGATTVTTAGALTALRAFTHGELSEDRWHELCPNIPFTPVNVGRLFGVPDDMLNYQTKDAGKVLTFGLETGKTTAELGMIHAQDYLLTRGGAWALKRMGARKAGAWLASKGVGRLAGPLFGAMAGWTAFSDVPDFTKASLAELELKGGGAIIEGAIVGSPFGGPVGAGIGAGVGAVTAAGRAFYEVRRVRLAGEEDMRVKAVDKTIEDAMKGFVKHDRLDDNPLTEDAKNRINEMGTNYFNSLIHKNGLFGTGPERKTLTPDESEKLQEILSRGTRSVVENEQEIERLLNWKAGGLARMFESGEERLSAGEINKLIAMNNERQDAEKQLTTFYQRGILSEYHGEVKKPTIKRDELREFNRQFKRVVGTRREEDFIQGHLPLINDILANKETRNQLGARAPDIYASETVQAKVKVLDSLDRTRKELQEGIGDRLSPESQKEWEDHLSGLKTLTAKRWMELVDEASSKIK